MRQITWTMVLTGILGVLPAAAQTVVQPVRLDSAQAALRDGLEVLRDSLHTVDGAAARLQRDYRTASEASLLSRAGLMMEACARSNRTVPPTRKTVLEFRLSDRQKLQLRQQVVTALDSLHNALRRCETQFTAMSRSRQGENVRGYANNRAEQVQTAIRNYEQHLRHFVGSLGIRILPPGMGSPAANR
ncbi:MAG TPA: hypothetical protein VE282_07560 [Gemmatimonadales bacterium]|nr:hypothetical protein [Gemmatimonadales bacterium]